MKLRDTPVSISAKGKKRTHICHLTLAVSAASDFTFLYKAFIEGNIRFHAVETTLTVDTQKYADHLFFTVSTVL